MLNSELKQWVIHKTHAQDVQDTTCIQSLWSGYGEVSRLHLKNNNIPSMVLKHIRFPTEAKHPHGWHSDFSHQRKVKSYTVEQHWYQDFATQCDSFCRVAHCYGTTSIADEHVILLEDLDASGFELRKTWLTAQQAHVCLQWLANFHATFLQQDPKELWPVGTYWHLATRPDEWQAMPESPLKKAASGIDKALNQAKFQTLVHGDAKVANFCFSADAKTVAAVDFQYVGAGCGIKDVAYFLGSCLHEQQEIMWEQSLLDAYFEALQQALTRLKKDVHAQDLEQEWRSLFPIAQADFSRFLTGWRPEHWKINDHNRHIASQVAAAYQPN